MIGLDLQGCAHNKRVKMREKLDFTNMFATYSYIFYFVIFSVQAWKFSQNDRFVTASFPSLIKDGNYNSFLQIHLHNINAFFEALTGKQFYNLAYTLHFLHTYLHRCTNNRVFHNNSAIINLSIMLSCAVCYKK